MNEDRDTHDRDDGPTTEGGHEGALGGKRDVWARAAERALRDIARIAEREQSKPKTVVP